MTASASSAELDRKALKRPDAISTTLRSFFEAMAKNTRFLGIMLIAAIAALVATGAVMSQTAARSDEAKTALYLAEKTLQSELSAMAEALSPPEKKKNAQDAKSGAQEERRGPESVAYRKFDVDAKLAESVKKLQAVSADFDGTRAAFEARVLLGSLYYNHGQPEKAVPWFEKALEGAPNAQEKAFSLQSLGYALESSGKPQAAVANFEKALKFGEAGLKGDLLLAIARNHEQAKDTVQAGKFYDQILSELPNTEQARAAQQAKARLE